MQKPKKQCRKLWKCKNDVAQPWLKTYYRFIVLVWRSASCTCLQTELSECRLPYCDRKVCIFRAWCGYFTTGISNLAFYYFLLTTLPLIPQHKQYEHATLRCWPINTTSVNDHQPLEGTLVHCDLSKCKYVQMYYGKKNISRNKAGHPSASWCSSIRAGHRILLLYIYISKSKCIFS